MKWSVRSILSGKVRPAASEEIVAPFTIPSGIVTTGPTVIARIARAIPQIGFLTTKTISVEPREGYREPILYEYYPGCFVNAVGLANPGARAFLDATAPLLPLSDDKPLVVSIMGTTTKEFGACAEILDPIADAFELNFSCPHVKGAGQSVGSDVKMVREIVALLADRFRKPIIPKLSPNLGDIAGMARVCEEAGASALTLINTVGPGIACDAAGDPILSNETGGLSGAGVLPVGLKAVREAASVVDIPIIACGGISFAKDVTAYRQAGASLFGVGSALVGMTTLELTEFFDRLEREVKEGAAERSTGSVPLVGVRTLYQESRVTDNTPLTPGMFRLRLDRGPRCDPGQFFFLRIPGVGEKPFSPSRDTAPEYLVRTVGPFTRALEALGPGDSLQMRGPYGRGFPAAHEVRNIVLVGGGTGSAPILMAAEKLGSSVSVAFFGFSLEPGALLREEIERACPNAQVCVDPPKRPGEVVRALAEDTEAHPERYEECAAYLCGPEPMMRAAAAALLTVIPRDRIFTAREDIMKCGVGICGSCATPSGLRSCVDGPVTLPE